MYKRPDLLDVRRLRLLYELSLRGTLAEVAEALHQSPSSVSQALTQLEHEVGVPLLEKAGRRVRLTSAAEEGGATLLVSGVDPGWGNDALAVTAASLCTRINTITCQEIFDYSTYNQPFAVKVSCGFGTAMGPEDPVPMMLLPTIPTMVWGGNIRLIGRGLGLEIDEITEEVERLPLEETVDTVMGPFEKGTQGAFFLKVIGWSGGKRRVVIEHITRIHPSCAPHWPQPDEGVGDHRVIVDGDPQLTITTRADLPGGTRADGGNTTAANRLLGALNWLAEQKPGIYDGLQVPLRSVLPPEAEVTRWA